ncbi:MAG: permease [Clostridia bacterium]|nr:permease [Clostridia bacterium]
MNLFGGIIPVTGITFLVFCLFAIATVGYSIGRIEIKGISLGTAGVFIAALVFGALFYDDLAVQLPDYTGSALKIVENIGLILFVTSVGFIAGPKFFGNMKKNFKSYVLLGLIIILAGGLSAVACIYIGRAMGETNNAEFASMVAGLLSGALTSTPAFSAAKATVASKYVGEMAAECEAIVSVGNGIAYIFGVVGVVLFVQLMPKILKVDMEVERAKLTVSNDTASSKKVYNGKLIEMDSFGIMPFALASVLGIIVGMIKIPLSAQGLGGTTFSLTTTGGCLLMALIFGHFARVGKISIMPPAATLKVFREFGLMLFLMGAGIAGGAKFIEYFDPMYFVYGVIMTILPLIIGFLFAKYVLKLSLLNNLGSITGGMTSTPALGTLINVSGTEDVAAAYAATYPIALISVVIVSQFVIILFG